MGWVKSLGWGLALGVSLPHRAWGDPWPFGAHHLLSTGFTVAGNYWLLVLVGVGGSLHVRTAPGTSLRGQDWGETP